MDLYSFSISSIDAQGVSHLIVEDSLGLHDTIETIRTVLSEASRPDKDCADGAAFDLTIIKSL